MALQYRLKWLVDSERLSAEELGAPWARYRMRTVYCTFTATVQLLAEDSKTGNIVGMRALRTLATEIWPSYVRQPIGGGPAGRL